MAILITVLLVINTIEYAHTTVVNMMTIDLINRIDEVIDDESS